MSSLSLESRVRSVISEKLVGPYAEVGVVVGVINAKNQYIQSQGYTDESKRHPVSAETLFEIGDLTKVFTALLMADMVKRGEVKFDDSVSKYTSNASSVAPRDDRATRLIDLATSSAGAFLNIPRVAVFHRDALIAGQAWQIESVGPAERRSGSARAHRFADIGFGLLGQSLAKRHKSSYRQVLRDRLLRPLDLESTSVGQGSIAPERIAQGHDADMNAVPSHLHLTMLAGCEGLSSTASDMMKFLEAALHHKFTRFAFALRTSLSVRRATMSPEHLSAMGWAILQRDGRDVLWQGSDVDGFSAWIGLDPAAQKAVVVLANVGTPIATEIGFRLMLENRSMSDARLRVGIKGDRLEAMAGNYRLEDGAILTVTRADDHLALSLDGQPTQPAYATSDRRFAAMDEKLTFMFDFENEAAAHPKRVVVYHDTQIRVADRLAAKDMR